MDLEDDFERANYNEQPKPLPLDVKSGDAYVASILIYLVQNLRSTDIEFLKQFLIIKTLNLIINCFHRSHSILWQMISTRLSPFS